MSLRLFVVRHGETEWSQSGQHSGRSDLLLTKCGEEQAKRIGGRIDKISFSHVFSSPLKRAMQTCELAGLGDEVTIEPDLTEWDNGDYEGLTGLEINVKRPGWNLFRDGCPNGESPVQVSDRADRLIRSLCDLDGDVILFMHGHFGRVLVARWIGLPIQYAEHFMFDTGAMSVLGFVKKQSIQPSILLWNSSSAEAFDKLPKDSATSANDSHAAPSKPREIDRWENEGGEVTIPRAGEKPVAVRSQVRHG